MNAPMTELRTCSAMSAAGEAMSGDDTCTTRVCDGVDELNLSEQQLSSMPSTVTQMDSLNSLDLSRNVLTLLQGELFPLTKTIITQLGSESAQESGGHSLADVLKAGHSTALLCRRGLEAEGAPSQLMAASHARELGRSVQLRPRHCPRYCQPHELEIAADRRQQAPKASCDGDWRHVHSHRIRCLK